MNIILYKSNAEKNRLDKSSLLTEIASLTGSLRDNSSIVSPSIRIRGGTSFFQANYLYIAEFNRYYFIEDIIVEHTMDIIIKAHVDVLMSWKDEIVTNHAHIIRSTNLGDVKLTDDINMPSMDFDIRMVYRSTSAFVFTQTRDRIERGDAVSYQNRSFNTIIVLRYSSFSTLNSYAYESTTYDAGEIYTNPNTGARFPLKGAAAIITDDYVLDLIVNRVGGNLESLSNILSAYVFPFNIYETLKQNNSSDMFYKLTELPVGDDVVSFPEEYQNFLLIKPQCNFKLSTDVIDVGDIFRTYVDYEPYVKYKLNIPFYGQVDVSSKQLKHNLKIEMFLDALNGAIVSSYGIADYVNIVGGYNVLGTYVSYASQCLIGSSNYEQIQRQQTVIQTQGMSSTVMGLFSGLIAGISALSGNVAGVIGGLTGALGGIASGINKSVQAANLPETSGYATGGSSLTYSFRDYSISLLKIEYAPKILPNSNQDTFPYDDMLGYPADTINLISNATGFLQIDECHLDNVPATSTELDEILSLLREGILK